LDISFDGTAYHGWQIQPHDITVEETIENALETLLRQPIDIVGAGRTDAGVHARQMPAHFDFDAPIDCNQLSYKLNRLLPTDIVVNGIQPVATDMHARFSATSRTYRYYIYTAKNPFLGKYACLITFPLDFKLMNEAAAQLLRNTDFAAFCKVHTDVKTTLCHVFAARWVQTSPSEWHFEITADRFLRNMVRAIVGTLIDVGRHRLTLEQFDEIVKSGNRCQAGESMPAKALFLERVEYKSSSTTHNV